MAEDKDRLDFLQKLLEEDKLSFLQEQVDKEKRTIGKTILTYSVTGERWSLPKRKISIRGIIDRITYRVEKET